MKNIAVKSPTRVDLAGGTLDLWPLYLFMEGASTVNCAIDIYTYAEIMPQDNESIELYSEDLQLRKQYKNLEQCLSDADPKLKLLQVHLNYWRPQQGFKLSTKSESPIGGGLGGSSSLTISLLKAFEQFTARPFADNHRRVQVAHHMEAEVLNTPTGTQDYYPADSGGVNFLSYNYDGIRQQVISPEGSPIASHFLLAYTGKSHHSGINNFEVMQKAVAKDLNTLECLRQLKRIAQETEAAIKEKAWTEFPRLFQEEYKFRTNLAKAFTSPEIEKLQRLSIEAGADAVKICGAGGGGCVMIWVRPQHRQQVIESCQKEGFQVLNAAPVNPLS